MPLKIVQTSQQVSSEKWDWEIHIEGESKDLDRIESILYNIAHDFSSSSRIYDRSSGFKIKRSGWASSPIYLIIKVKNKEKHVGETIQLNFDHPVEKALRI